MCTFSPTRTSKPFHQPCLGKHRALEDSLDQDQTGQNMQSVLISMQSLCMVMPIVC